MTSEQDTTTNIEETETAAEEQQDAAPQEELPSFAELGLDAKIISAIEAMEITKPTDVQAAAIPLALQGRDLLVQSRTGTGKTLAFGAPIVQRLMAAERKPQALVLAPTRELALQVADECSRIAADSTVDIVAIYGGAAMGPQISALKQGTQLVAGTPGRVLDHIRRRNLDTSGISTLVLDEGDEMLSMGFLEEISAIIEALPQDRHTMIFSATIPEEIKRLVARYTRDPERLILSEDFIGVREISHSYYLVTGSDRHGDLMRVLEAEEPGTALIFCNTRDDTASVAAHLEKNGFAAEGISSDLTQKDRERVMGRMRAGELKYLVATDVAARGIDLSDLSHVINYTFPESPDVYIHRTGRTGRAGKSGAAVSLVSPREIGSFYYLKLTHKIIPEERHLPTADELATRREAKRFTQLLDHFEGCTPSEEMLRLARRALSTVDGERLFALAMAKVLDEMGEVRVRQTLLAERGLPETRRPAPRRSASERSDRGGDDRGPRRSGRGERGERGGRRPERGERRGRRDKDPRERKTTRTRRREAPPSEQGSFTTPDGDVEHWETVEAPRGSGRSERRSSSSLAPEDSVRLFINVGRHQGVRTGDLARMVTEATGLDNDDVARIQVRGSFSFFDVPTAEADNAIEKLGGATVKDREVRVERAKS